MPSALVYGCTGLTGKHILQALLETNVFDPVHTVSRRSPKADEAKSFRAYEKMRQVANDVAMEAVRVAKGLSYQPTVTLDAAGETLSLGVRKPTT